LNLIEIENKWANNAMDNPVPRVSFVLTDKVRGRDSSQGSLLACFQNYD
jgi:hypothetical protein